MKVVLKLKFYTIFDGISSFQSHSLWFLLHLILKAIKITEKAQKFQNKIHCWEVKISFYCEFLWKFENQLAKKEKKILLPSKGADYNVEQPLLWKPFYFIESDCCLQFKRFSEFSLHEICAYWISFFIFSFRFSRHLFREFSISTRWKEKKIGNKKLLFSGWKEKPKPHDGNWMKFLNLIWIILKKNSKLYWHTLHWLKYCEHGLLLCVPPFKIRLPNSLNSTDYHSDKTKRKENLFKLYVHLMIHYNPTR